MYRLVNNHDYELTGVYYRGLNKKYSDMFDITAKEFVKVYMDINDATKDKEMLKRRFDRNFDIETVEEETNP